MSQDGFGFNPKGTGFSHRDLYDEVGSVESDNRCHYAVSVRKGPLSRTITIGSGIELDPLRARALARLLELAADTLDKRWEEEARRFR